jgi:hypothetical protein
VGELTGLNAGAVHGGFADTTVAARWLDDGITPNGASGRGFTTGSVHGFDLTFAAPKSVSLLRALTEVLVGFVGDSRIDGEVVFVAAAGGADVGHGAAGAIAEDGPADSRGGGVADGHALGGVHGAGVAQGDVLTARR